MQSLPLTWPPCYPSPSSPRPRPHPLPLPLRPPPQLTTPRLQTPRRTEVGEHSPLSAQWLPCSHWALFSRQSLPRRPTPTTRVKKTSLLPLIGNGTPLPTRYISQLTRGSPIMMPVLPSATLQLCPTLAAQRQVPFLSSFSFSSSQMFRQGCFSLNSSLLVSAYGDGELAVWSLLTRPLPTLLLPSLCTS